MTHTRKARHSRKRSHSAKKSHKKSAKKAGTSHRKKGGNLGLVMSQLATPAVLIAANQMYGKKSRNRHMKSYRRR